MTKISASGRQTLGAKANAQKATGSAGKFGHLQKDAPEEGLKPLATPVESPQVPRLKKEGNPYARLSTRAELEVAHQRMTNFVDKAGGITGGQEEFDAYYQDRLADLDAAQADQMEALEAKLSADNARAQASRRRTIYFDLAASDTQARLALHDLRLHFPSAESVHLENEDLHTGSGAPLNAVRVLDAGGMVLFDTNSTTSDADNEAYDLMAALSEHSEEMDWDGLGHLKGESQGSFYSVPIAVAYEPQHAYLTNPGQADAPVVPPAKRRYLSECNTIEHLEFRMLALGSSANTEVAQNGYSTRLAELRAAGL